MEIIVAIILSLFMGAVPAQWGYMCVSGSKKRKQFVGIVTWLAFSAIAFLAAMGE